MSYFDIEHWTKKGLNENEAREKVKDLKERTNRYRVEYWLRKGFSENEAKNKISEIQRKNNSKVDHKNKPHTTRIDYWLKKGYDEETAKQKLKERQTTFTLEKCIKKYGETKGLEIFNNRQIKWQKTLNENNDRLELNKKRGINKDQFIKKYGEDKYKILVEIRRFNNSKEGYIKMQGEDKYNERINNIKKSLEKRGFGKISNISQSLFQEIEIEINEKCYYGKEEQIIQFYNEDKYFCYYVDFKIGNKIIEFYGDYWHVNPTMYKSEDIVGSKYDHSKVKDIWERDEKRINLIKEKGYDILIIWEDDFEKNKEETKNKCIKWIKNL